MKTTTRMLLIACLSLPMLAACQNGADEGENVEVVQAPMAAPTGTDPNQWNAYLTDVVTRNIGESTSTYVYTLPPVDSEGFEGAYGRQLDKARTDVARGVNAGTLLAFGSSSSQHSADLTVAAFEQATPGTLEGVRVLFIGAPADSERVQAAVEPSGAAYVFIEAK
ncbi:MAG: hypothetical protein KY442_10580 [Proteobacteria bacterium]|nr:hypothetical protein [Pseudomonadota bacterium]